MAPNRYFVILDTEHRSLLFEALESRNQHSWLRNLAQIGRRRALWEGLSRIAEGLSILHDEGTLHRRLPSECIFTGLQGECDFRLSGSEWSLRVSARSAAGSRTGEHERPRAPELEAPDAQYSTATDYWFAFGILAAEVFGMRMLDKKVRRLVDVTRDVETSPILAGSERSLIMELLSPDPTARLARGPEAIQRIGEVVTGLRTQTASSSRRLFVDFRLGPNRSFGGREGAALA